MLEQKKKGRARDLIKRAKEEALTPEEAKEEVLTTGVNLASIG